MLNKNINLSRIMKCYLIIALIALTGIAAKAQTRFRTDESIASQIKNGTAPGLLFSKSVPTKKEAVTATVNTESLGKQIRSNTLPGLQYQKPTAKPETELNGQTQPNAPLIRDKALGTPKSVEKAAVPAGAQ